MSIGSTQTLHGYLDAKVRAKNNKVYLVLPSNGSNPDESPVNDRNSTIVEGKRSVSTF